MSTIVLPSSKFESLLKLLADSDITNYRRHGTNKVVVVCKGSERGMGMNPPKFELERLSDKKFQFRAFREGNHSILEEEEIEGRHNLLNLKFLSVEFFEKIINYSDSMTFYYGPFEVITYK